MDVMEVWNLELPALPERSRFYHLEPIGVGTPYTEGLTSYIIRLAEAHCVTPKALVVRELFPLLGRLTLLEQNPRIHHEWRGDATTINGTNAYAEDWVRALESLTFRSDLSFLTMLTWSGVIVRWGLLRGTQAWCPECFSEWRSNKNCFYSPLLWSLKEVTVCPRHLVRLSTHCPHEDCLRPIPFLCRCPSLGYCPYCRRSLDSVPVSLGVKNKAIAYGNDLEKQCWMANAIGELIEAAPSLSVRPLREKLASSISQCSNQLAEGCLSLLERRLGLNRGIIPFWQRQDSLPQLKSLLELSYRLGITPRLLLIEAVEDYSKITSLKPSKRCSRKPIGADELRKVLEACLLEEPPPSLKEVTTRLGYSQEGYLYKRFSELYRSINARYASVQKSMQSRTIKRRSKIALDELREYLQEVLMSDEMPLPSISEISKRLGYRSNVKSISRRAPDLCAAIAEKRRQQLNDRPLRQVLEAALVSNEYPPPTISEIAERLSCSIEKLYHLYPKFCHALEERHRSVFDSDTIRKELEAALANPSFPPPSFRDVARGIGLNESRLRLHFPELCAQISRRYQAFRKNSGMARRKHIQDKVKSAVIQLSVEGYYPSITKVRQLLQGEKYSVIDVTKAWRGALREFHPDEEE